MTKGTCMRLVSPLAFLLMMPAPSPGQARADAQADVQAELAKARQLWAAKDYRNACKSYQRANELAQGKSAPSLIGLSACFTSLKEGTKAVEMARQARAVAATPEEQALATKTLGYDLLRQPDEASWTEAASLFKEQVASSGGAEGRGGLISALLSLHRDQEAAEILQSLRKQGTTEDEIQHKILFQVAHSVSGETPRRIDDLNEHLYRLDPKAPLAAGGNRYSEPKILHQVKPEPTDEARWHPGFQGTVIVEGIIDEQGKLRDVRAIKEQPYGLTEAAVKAVKAWTFQPGVIDGKPVRIYYVLSVDFKIQ
jgi:TonB family protein